jgi:hypothetical protein
MSSLLAYFDIGIAINIAIFVATLVFAQKIKDWFKGVPTHLRTGLSAIEAGVLAQVKNYEQDLVNKIVPPPAPVAKPPAPPAAP